MDTSTKQTGVGHRLRFKAQRLVDIRWMLRAAKLPGKTASLAVALWAAVTASGRPEVTLTATRLRQVGMSRDSGYAAIDRLVEAVLVKADRGRGRPARLTLLDEKGQPLRVAQAA